MKHSFRYLVVILFAVAQGDSNHLRRKLPVGGSGSEAAISQFPGVVKLLSRNADSRTDKICSGALIKSDLVVTAASCTYALNDQPADSSSQAIVHGSATNSTGGLSRTWQAYSVHPDYVLGSQTDDIALIKLSEPMDSVETVDARFVWFTDATPGTLVTASGYGQGRIDSGNSTLRMASLSVVEEGSGGCVTGSVAKVVCADSDTQDLCLGDEGAPLINGDNDLVGIYSYGGKCSGEDGTPKFTRATYYKNFLEAQACTLDSDNCTGLGIAANLFGTAFTVFSNVWLGIMSAFNI